MYIVPNPICVKPMEEYKLYIKFENGEERIFDMSKYINHKFYKNLREYKYFEKVRIMENTIVWENGEDVSPENLLYYESKEK